MENSKEIKPVLEYTNGVGTQGFQEGDAVICFSGSKIYKGTIVAFSNYKENKDADPQYSVYLDTSKSSMSRSCEIINIADITYMCKNPANDLLDYPQINEEYDKGSFISMIVGLGYDEEKANNVYEVLKGIINLYNIPLFPVLVSAIQNTELSVDGKCQDELMKIADKIVSIMVSIFHSTTESLRDELERN